MHRQLIVLASLAGLAACSSDPQPAAANAPAPAVTQPTAPDGQPKAGAAHAPGHQHASPNNAMRNAPAHPPSELMKNAPEGVDFGPGDPTQKPVVKMVMSDGAGGDVTISEEAKKACEKPVNKLVELGRMEAKARNQTKYFEEKILPGMKGEFVVGCLRAMKREPVLMKAFGVCLAGATDSASAGICFKKFEAKLRPIFAPNGNQPPPVDPSIGAPPPVPGPPAPDRVGAPGATPPAAAPAPGAVRAQP
jgi:hypothetical protein